MTSYNLSEADISPVVIEKRTFLDEIEYDEPPFIQRFYKKEKIKWHQYICDCKRKTCCRRTGYLWFELLLFYLFFFLASVAFATFIGTQFMMLVVDRPYPNVQKPFPGLSIIPMGSGNSLKIEFSITDKNEISKLVEMISKFVDDYNDNIAKSLEKYRYNNKTNDIEAVFGPCTRNNSYGYKSGQPCVILKMNKIHGFKPQPYSKEKLPNDMSEEYKTYILSNSDEDAKSVWISCAGITEENDKALGNAVLYPRRGIHVNFFPWHTHPIAVQFPQLKLDEKVTVECRMWAKNIEYEKLSPIEDLYGTVTFNIHIKP